MNTEQGQVESGQPDLTQVPPSVAQPQPAGQEQNLFWVVLALFVVLGLDAAFRLSDLLNQRSQLDQARLAQAQNLGRLAEGQQAQERLQTLSLDVLQMSATNETARRIVQEFNIQFSPSPAPSSPPTVSVSAPQIQPETSSHAASSQATSLLSAPSNVPPISTNALPATTNTPASK